MKIADANAILSTVTSWAIKRDDIRAMALVGSWARGNPRKVSDIDLLLLSDHQDEYRRRRKWLTEIEFKAAGYQLRSSHSVAYGVVWSRHVHLRPAAEVELTFASLLMGENRAGRCWNARRGQRCVPDHLGQRWNSGQASRRCHVRLGFKTFDVESAFPRLQQALLHRQASVGDERSYFASYRECL
jgi:predicted nucleotidyltransferase